MRSRLVMCGVSLQDETRAGAATKYTLRMATHSKRVAEGIGRRPGVVCGVSTLITLLVSVLALVVGEFTVSADNDGWQSRTTELANRQMQLEATERGFDERHWSRPPVASRRKLHTSNESKAAQLLAAKPKAARVIKRRLLESDPPDSEVSECWNGHAEWNDPLVVYRAKDAATDLLSPAVFQQVLASPSALYPYPCPYPSPRRRRYPYPKQHVPRPRQVCELEGRVLAARGYNAACRAPEGSGCTLVNDGACLAPVSATSQLRSATPGGPPHP